MASHYSALALTKREGRHFTIQRTFSIINPVTPTQRICVRGKWNPKNTNAMWLKLLFLRTTSCLITANSHPRIQYTVRWLGILWKTRYLRNKKIIQFITEKCRQTGQSCT